MNQWAFVIVAYGIVLLATVGLVLKLERMRVAEADAEARSAAHDGQAEASAANPHRAGSRRTGRCSAAGDVGLQDRAAYFVTWSTSPSARSNRTSRCGSEDGEWPSLKRDQDGLTVRFTVSDTGPDPRRIPRHHT